MGKTPAPIPKRPFLKSTGTLKKSIVDISTSGMEPLIFCIPEPEVKQCYGCGAMGQYNNCEYCGNTIK
jgi:hypothetical protein